jgi:hypothetical protein
VRVLLLLFDFLQTRKNTEYLSDVYKFRTKELKIFHHVCMPTKDDDEDANNNNKNRELILYDQHLTSIAQLKSKYTHASTVHILNLHANRISRISDLSDFIYLQSLDLSSNEIQKIEGLSVLKQLQVLNLSSNKVS